MSTRKCHLGRCDAVITFKGDGASYSESVDGLKVFFCSLEHWVEYHQSQSAAPTIPEPRLKLVDPA